MQLKSRKGTKFRIMVNDWGLYSVERRFLWFIWWPVLRSYSSRGAVAYTKLCGAEYNETTDLFEVTR